MGYVNLSQLTRSSTQILLVELLCIVHLEQVPIRKRSKLFECSSKKRLTKIDQTLV